MAVSAKWAMVAVTVAALGFFAGRCSKSGGEDAAIVLPAVEPLASPVSRGAAVKSQPQPISISSLREILQLESIFARATALHMLASRKDGSGIETLLNEAAAIASSSDRDAVLGILYNRLGELDPNAAVDRIVRSGDLELRYLDNVFRIWVRDNVQQALARAASLGDQRSRQAAMSSILEARTDLPQAQRRALADKYNIWLSALDPRQRPDLTTPERAQRSWREALALADPEQRSAHLEQIAYAWGRRSPQEALQAIEQLNDFDLRNYLLQRSVRGWAEKSPREAYEWAQARPPSRERVELLRSTLESLLQLQPEAAMELAAKLPRTEQQTLFPNLLGQWAKSDLSAASSWVDSIKDPALHFSVLSTVAYAYARTRDPDAALRWAASLAPADAQKVMPYIIVRIAETDPLRASSMVSTLASGGERDSVVHSVAHSWSREDPAAALAWVLRTASGQARYSAAGNIFERWAASDSAAVAQQVAQLTDPMLRDIAAWSVLANSQLDTDLAEQMYSRIENPEARRNAAERLYQILLETDPPRAERYRRESGTAEAPPRR